MTKAIQRPVVYLDACFISHWAGQDLLDPLQAEKHEMSLAWWRLMRTRVRPVVSEVVVAEISAGPQDGAAMRIELVRRLGLPVWKESPESLTLGNELLRTRAVKRTKPLDAAHIALAAVGGADVLLIWNFRDIVNENKMPQIKLVVERFGYRCPLLVSPDKLPEDWP